MIDILVNRRFVTLGDRDEIGATAGVGVLGGIIFSDTGSFQDSNSHGFVILGATLGWTTDINGISGLFFGYGGKGGGIGFFNEWNLNTTLYPSVTWIPNDC